MSAHLRARATHLLDTLDAIEAELGHWLATGDGDDLRQVAAVVPPPPHPPLLRHLPQVDRLTSEHLPNLPRASDKEPTMTVYPPPVAADARNRALRTFLQGLAVDVAAAVVAVLVTSLGTVEWTSAYWLGLAALLGKTLLGAVVSYFARKFVPPNP